MRRCAALLTGISQLCSWSTRTLPHQRARHPAVGIPYRERELLVVRRQLVVTHLPRSHPTRIRRPFDDVRDDALGFVDDERAVVSEVAAIGCRTSFISLRCLIGLVRRVHQVRRHTARSVVADLPAVVVAGPARAIGGDVLETDQLPGADETLRDRTRLLDAEQRGDQRQNDNHDTDACAWGCCLTSRSTWPSRMATTRCAYAAVSASCVTRMIVLPP